MSLQGTLDTFSLPDVLKFLAASSKTGRLVVTNKRGGGDVWLDDGAVVAAETERATEPVDAVFDLLRDEDGSFDFNADLTRSDGVEPIDVEELVVQAEARLTEWQEIEAVVPSLDVAVHLAPDIPGGAVRIESEQWRALVAVAESGSVSAVGQRLDQGEFDACKTVKELAERGLVSVGDGPVASAVLSDLAETGADEELDLVSDAEPAVELQEEADDTADHTAEATAEGPADDTTEDDIAAELEKLGPEAAKAVEAAARATTPEERAKALAAVGDDDPNRGLLLKFLSSVRS